MKKHDVYLDSSTAWNTIPDGYKDFRIASNDSIIPSSASFYQAEYNKNGNFPEHKIIPGKHRDPYVTAIIWKGVTI